MVCCYGLTVLLSGMIRKVNDVFPGFVVLGRGFCDKLLNFVTCCMAVFCVLFWREFCSEISPFSYGEIS